MAPPETTGNGATHQENVAKPAVNSIRTDEKHAMKVALGRLRSKECEHSWPIWAVQLPGKDSVLSEHCCGFTNPTTAAAAAVVHVGLAFYAQKAMRQIRPTRNKNGAFPVGVTP